MKNSKRTYFACLILILIIAQVVFDISSLSYAHKTRNSSSDLISENLTSSSVDGLLKPAVVDSASGYSYIPEAKLILPHSGDSLTQIEYTYYSPSPVQPKEVDITSNQNISYAKSRLLDTVSTGTANRLFNDVPDLQACSTAFSIYFSPESTAQMNGEYVQVYKKTLQDNSTLYIYKNNQCSAPYMGELQNLLEKVQSYSS